ncbi:DUF4870 domain-containing protein [Knoellia sp. S7-12]|uniref:DUF4870 domain-containing protein n=1 Tax=Knoellia sp. S7-12 TaxID=3126698 RepID=UPI003366C4AA
MSEGNYQEQLRRELHPSAPSAPSAALKVDDGRRFAAALHVIAATTVLVPPIALVTHVSRKDHRPLVRMTASAILRFHAQQLILLVAGVGLALVTHHDQTAGVLTLVWLAAALLCPLLGALQTWRTGRVFRYPIWDLLRR